MIVQLQGNNPLPGRRLREHQSHAGLVLIRRTIGRVMHLKHKIGSRGHELCHPVRPPLRRTARRIHQEQIAGGLVRLAPLQRIAQRRRRERRSHWRMPQPLGIRRTNIHHRVMHMGRTSRAKLRHLHPPILGKMRRHNLVGVCNFSGRRNVYGSGHLYYEIGLRNIPSHCPFSRRGCVVRIPLRRARRGPRGNRRDLLWS